MSEIQRGEKKKRGIEEGEKRIDLDKGKKTGGIDQRDRTVA